MQDFYTLFSQHPLVSVIIPAYNAETFIEKTLRSVLNQTYRQIEVLVVDDGSSDRTPELVKAIAQQDDRVILLTQPNSGVAAARNLAIQKAKGEFIAPIDADDVWYPENLERQVRCFLESKKSVGVVYSWSLDIDEADLPTDGYHTATVEGDVFSTLLCHNFIGNASATMVRRSCLDAVGGYNAYFRELNAQGCEDWDLYLRLAEKYHFRVVPKFLVGYRKISGSMSRDYGKMADSHNLMLTLAQERRPDIPSTLFKLSRSSFYLYLAYQSRQHQCYRGVLYWLLQMLRADSIASILRPGLYRLAMESVVRLTIKEVAALIGPDTPYWTRLKTLVKRSLHVLSSFIPKRYRQSFGVKLKVWISNGLHHSLPFVFGQPKA
ncbi:MAG TPA: glycosyltransferase family A protein [Crinalium sp.]|jgi:glycosyltransferase involved in cell wall biosynthesis